MNDSAQVIRWPYPVNHCECAVNTPEHGC